MLFYLTRDLQSGGLERDMGRMGESNKKKDVGQQRMLIMGEAMLVKEGKEMIAKHTPHQVL